MEKNPLLTSKTVDEYLFVAFIRQGGLHTTKFMGGRGAPVETTLPLVKVMHAPPGKLQRSPFMPFTI